MTDTLLAPSELPEGDIPFVAEQIQQDQTARRTTSSRDALKPIVWRLHFIGGFLTGPVVLALCLTGALFAWYPQIDGLRFGSIINGSDVDGQVLLSKQVAAAAAEHPDWEVFGVTPAHDGYNTNVVMGPPGGEQGFREPSDAQYVYVDPSSGEVTGTLDPHRMSNSAFRSLHPSFGLGPRAEPITELAGSRFLASLITGVVLWWPSLRRRDRLPLRPEPDSAAAAGTRIGTTLWA